MKNLMKNEQITNISRRKILSSLATSSMVSLGGCETFNGDTSDETSISAETTDETFETTLTATITSEPDEKTSEEDSDVPTTTPPANISVASVSLTPNSVGQFEPLEIEIKMANTGGKPNKTTIELFIDGASHSSASIRVEPDETRVVRFVKSFSDPGVHEIRVGDRGRRFTVEERVLKIDVSGMTYWERLMFTCLQGIMNRDDKSLYLHFKGPDNHWASWYNDEYGLEFSTVEDISSFLREIDLPIEGYVMVDVQEPDTANLAANYASTRDLLPITEQILNRYDLPQLDIREDLRNRFTGQDKSQIYEWAFSNQWEDSNKQVVANLPTPNHVDVEIDEFTEGTDTIYIRFEDNIKDDGYGASFGGLFVSREGETIVQIIPGTPSEKDLLYESQGSWLYQGGRRIADKNQYWIYEIQGISNAETVSLDLNNEYLVKIADNPEGPYTTVASSDDRGGGRYRHKIRDHVVAEGGFFFELASDFEHSAERQLKGEILSSMSSPGYVFGWVDRFPKGIERYHVEQASKHNKLILGSYHDTSNFSIHSQIEEQPGPQPNSIDPEEVNVDSGKVYITFVLSDGDSVWMHSRFQAGNWLSNLRGKIPFGWEIQPLLKDLAPGMVDYYFKTASNSDSFVGSASGVGSQFPNRMSSGQLENYLTLSLEYLRELDIQTLWVRDDKQEGVSDKVARKYDQILGEQIFGVLERYWDRGGESRRLDNIAWVPSELPDSNPDGHGIKQQNAEELAESIRSISNQNNRRPLFIPVHLPVTQPSSSPPGERIGIATAYKIVQKLDQSEFKIVAPDEFFVAFMKAGDL